MKNSEITEAFIEVNKLHPTLQEIYKKSSDHYSNFKTLSMKKEHLINLQNVDNQGILHETNSIWYTKNKSLYIYNYCTTAVEEIKGFGHAVQFVKLFTPTKGIFSDSISHCYIVVTKHEAIIYAIENETNNIVYTDFSCKLLSQPSVVNVSNDKIFIGCEDGNVYNVIYKVIPILGFKSMSLYTCSNFISRALKTILKRKSDVIKTMSVGKTYLAALNNNLVIYDVTNLIKQVKSFGLGKKYISCQILEEQPFLASCTEPNGNRDFFSFDGKIFSKDFKENIKDNDTLEAFSDMSKQIYLRRSNGISFLSLLTQNEDQLINFKPDMPNENCEQINVDLGMNVIYLKNNTLIVLSSNKIKEYEILNHKKLLLNCRTEEIYTLHQNYGDLYFMVKYFELLAENENVYRIEPFCKNKNIKRFAFFCYLAKALKPIWRESLHGIISNNEKLIYFNKLTKKFVNLEKKVNLSGDFIEELSQTYHYCSFLNDYGIIYDETLETILTKTNESFKKNTLQKLLKIFEKNKSIDSLLKTMNNMCPKYLPIDQINNQRGIELLNTKSPVNMKESLKYFTNCNQDIIELFTKQKYFYGATYIMRHSFALNKVKYETMCKIAEQSVRCKGAMVLGLQDSRETFLYPFFEALLNIEEFSDCVCCSIKTTKPNLLLIENPLFEQFLKEKKSSNLKTINLLWKYQLAKGKNESAVETLLTYSHALELDLETKVGFLETALSISPTNAQIKKNLDMFKIQKEMARRKQLNINRLLTADSLLNDYLYDEYDLAILLLDALDHKNKKTFKEFYKTLIVRTKDIDVIFELLEKLKNKVNVVEYFLFELIEKVTNNNVEIKLGRRLMRIGFDKSEIVSTYKNILGNSTHPKIKERILKEMEDMTSVEECAEYRGFCEKVYGLNNNY